MGQSQHMFPDADFFPFLFTFLKRKAFSRSILLNVICVIFFFNPEINKNSMERVNNLFSSASSGWVNGKRFGHKGIDL